MVDIVVTRGVGLAEGDPFVSPLITTETVALAKGKALLDEFASMHSSVVLVVPFMEGLRLGDLVHIHETINGLLWAGKVTGISHTIDGPKSTTELTVDKVDANA